MNALLALLLSAKLDQVLSRRGPCGCRSWCTHSCKLFRTPSASGCCCSVTKKDTTSQRGLRDLRGLRGLRVSLPTFIPCVGAWIRLNEQQLDPETQAFVGLTGPLVGTTAALIVYLFALSNGSQAVLAIAYAGVVLNLFNLIPVVPLDGGHIVKVISPRIWLLGLPLSWACSSGTTARW